MHLFVYEYVSSGAAEDASGLPSLQTEGWAMLSAVLEEHDMAIVSADNGRDAIDILRENPGIDIVLMDIMMPEMDGLETMRAIRKIPALKNLPIVAVTAKAMKGDREKCIDAGAWDYLSKPVNAEQMLAVLRAWLHR